mgnify:CR=1 FL=1
MIIMNKTLALALYEFKGRLNFKADLIGFVLIAFLISSRLFAEYFVEDTVPLNLAILYNGNDSGLSMELETIADNLSIPFFKIEQSVVSDIDSGRLNAYLGICNDCTKPTIKVHSVGQFTALKYLNIIKSELEPLLLPQFYKIPKELYGNITNGIELEFVESNTNTYQEFLILNTLFMIITILGVLTAFAFLLQGITEEKDTKVTLMYMSCMEVREWIDSKVLASTCLSLKNFIVYIFIGSIGLRFFGIIELSNEDWAIFISDKLAYLAITFAVGYMFWCYLFAFVSTIINDPNSPIKSAAVLVPMTAFGIVLSLLDFVSTDFFKWLNYIPFTYLFTQSASIILTEIDKISFIISTSITSSVTLIVRVFAIKYVKFETIQ